MLRVALAEVETSHARGEAPSFSIRMGLTIAQDGFPASRAEATFGSTSWDDYKVGRLLVVSYDETRPWRVTVVTSPTPEWAPTAHPATSAPLSTAVSASGKAAIYGCDQQPVS